MENIQERSLWLSEEEAMGLLDIAVLSLSELTPAQRAAMSKLSEFCRQFLRQEKGMYGEQSRPVTKVISVQTAMAA